MLIKLEGKQHIAGISKSTNKPYDFCEIHYLGRRKNVEGLAAVKKSVGADVISANDIIVGAEYEMTVDDEGSIIEMRKASKSPSIPATGQQTKA